MKYCNSAKLTHEAVNRIFRRIAAGDVQKDIAKDEGVSQATITFLKQGKTYKHIPYLHN